MAALIPSDSDSDFGYDFTPEEEQLLLQLASNPASSLRGLPLVDGEAGLRTAVDAVPGKTDGIADGDTGVGHNDGLSHALGDHPASRLGAGPHVPRGEPESSTLGLPVALDRDVQYPNLSGALSKLEAEQLPMPPETADAVDPDAAKDDRSPIQRFRSFPRKPFTVSDLTSGAWCELQYWYTLTRLPGGRKTRTPAMKQGTKVHQKLEDEVHKTVKVDITSKSDGFGLRLWNLIQGLRTLRDKGLTRELEVWGTVEGNLVNGIIDSLSHENPNPEFEEELSSQESYADLKQRAVTDYFPPKKPGGSKDLSPKVYLMDVKTRGTLAPVSAALLRPAKIQLLLYHRCLSDMAAGRLDFLKVLRRYGLDPDEPFSDSFLAQIGELHDEIFFDAPTSSEPSGEEPSTTSSDQCSDSSSSHTGPDILRYRSLRELLKLVEDELKLAFPSGEQSLGHMLRVQYFYRNDGRELKAHDFPVSKQALAEHLDKNMEWWRGEREPEGVDIEEAFKCRSCEFASTCSWRQEMEDECIRKAQQKSWATRRRQP